MSEIIDIVDVAMTGPAGDASPEMISAAESRAAQVVDGMGLPAQVTSEVKSAVNAEDIPGRVDASITEQNIPGQIASYTEDQVPPLVAQAIAADDTVAQAAAVAVTADIAGRDLLETTNERLPQLMGDDEVVYAVTDSDGRRSWIEATESGAPSEHSVRLLGHVAPIPKVVDYASEWAYTVTDSDGRIAFGIRHDGTTFPAGGGDSNGLVFGGGYLAQVTHDGVLVEDMTTGTQTVIPAVSARQVRLDGGRVFFTDADVQRWAQAGEETSHRVFAEGIVMWGDSLTYANNGLLSTRLAALLGCPVIPRGVSGERSEAIASRQGGLTRMITVTGGSIPASGPVNVTADGVWVRPNQYQSAGVQIGTLQGVHGTLTQETDNSGIWQFTRTTAGDAVPVTAPTPWVSDDSLTYRDWLPIFWPGRNSFPDDIGAPTGDTSATATAIKQMVEYVALGSKRFIVMPVINGTDEGIGTVGHDRVIAHEQWLEATYPHNFVPIRRILIDHGLDLVGITPTPDDLDDIAADIVPRSLRSDYIHLTKYGYEKVVAASLAQAITEKGWAI